MSSSHCSSLSRSCCRRSSSVAVTGPVDGVVNWLLPDLHGSIAGSLAADESLVTNAIRYDAYGQTQLTGSGGGTAVGATAWTYQGRLDLSPPALATPLYDAGANPATMVDPTGHNAIVEDGLIIRGAGLYR